MTKSGNILYVRGYKREVVFYPLVTSLAAIQTFADEIQTLTNAGTEDVTFSQTEELNRPESSIPIEDTELEARISLRRTNPEPDEYPYRQVHIPAPKQSMFEFIDGKGYRVKDIIGEQVATAYSTLSGKTFEFVNGWLCGG
jgi:hypothetical protein